MAIAISTRYSRPRRQRGAVSVLVGVAIVMLLTMLGLVLDLGHLYIAKTELQNAADACALAAAWEIAPINDTTRDRATAAGIAVGTQNSVDFQSTTVDIQPGDVTFSATLDDAGFTRDVSAATRYVRCTPQGPTGKSVVMWLMWLWGNQSSSVGASATAGLQLCGFPLAFSTDYAAPTPANNFGFKVGSWYGGRLKAGTGVRGNYDWIKFDKSGASAVADLIAGRGDCYVLEEGQRVEGQTGVIQGVTAAWNTRFGLYGAGYKDPNAYSPDRTGYAFTWTPDPPPALPTSGTGSWARPPDPPPPADPICDAVSPSCNAYAWDDTNNPPARIDFRERQQAYEPFNPAAFDPKLTGYQRALTREELVTYGVPDRRLVIIPVMALSAWEANKQDVPVAGWACGLLLAPIPDTDTARIEYLGPARNSPCVGRGLPGNASVPQLVM